MKKKTLGIQVTPGIHFKMRYIALRKNRSLSKQVIQAICEFIDSFEAENGVIKLPPAVLAEMATEEDS